jgi:uncharacterized phage protein gp47/JayE
MGFPRPTPRELIDRAIADISSRTQGSAYIKRSPERVIATVDAKLADGLHGHLEWNQRQQLPTTADIEGLLGWGVWLKVDRKGATKSLIQIQFLNCAPGTSPPVGTLVKTVDGVVFKTTTTAAAFGSGVWIVQGEAVEAGSSGNQINGTPLTLVTSFAGMSTEGSVRFLYGGGSDVEDVEAYRGRILDNLRLPPAGGGAGDYVTWALECDGVTRAWEFGNRMGLGTVSVAFVVDARYPYIQPLPAEVAVVQAYIDARRPIDMRAVYVQAPTLVPVAMNLTVLPNTSAVRDAVLTELRYLFTRSADLMSPLALSKVHEAISTAVGEEDHTINSIGSLVPSDWQLLTLGTVTFT